MLKVCRVSADGAGTRPAVMLGLDREIPNFHIEKEKLAGYDFVFSVLQYN